MSKKQTSVEWLMVQLETYGDPGYCKIEWETLDELFEQAKEMEKGQIIEANENKMPFITGKEYYNETFKSE